MSELTLTLLQPAQIGDKARSDFVLGTQELLPGMVVRGAFAAAWIAANGQPDRSPGLRAEFVRLFEGDVRFGPLFYRGIGMTPLSVVSHKYPADGECQVTEYDRAIEDDVPARCPDCGYSLEHRPGPRGSIRGGPASDGSGGDRAQRAARRRRTSVAIAPSGVARRGQIVTRDTLEAGQDFLGSLIARDPELTARLAGLGPVRVGGRRTTHGTASVRIEDGGPPPTAQRLPDGRLVLRLSSPAVFVDDQGRPSRDPDPCALGEVLGCPVRIARRWYRWQAVGGWHIASGLPKPVELAVAAGSCYLLEPTGQVSDESLARLGQEGVGLRRHEGFGDLAPPPLLAAGRREREADAARLRKANDAVAPLRGLPATRREIWPGLLDMLRGHVAGDEQATAFLRRITEQERDRHLAGAFRAFLELPVGDAAHVVRGLSEL